jgi:hypothetical protein
MARHGMGKAGKNGGTTVKTTMEPPFGKHVAGKRGGKRGMKRGGRGR